METLKKKKRKKPEKPEVPWAPLGLLRISVCNVNHMKLFLTDNLENYLMWYN